jgi:uncharacterized protein (TIGR00369 family)
MQASELQRLVDSSAVHRALRLRVVGTGDGAITLTAEPVADHAVDAAGRVLHGGVVATLLDAAATFALIQATGTDWSTVDLRVDFLRPAPAGPLLACGTAVQAGRRLGRAAAELTDAATGQLLARAVGTFLRAPPAAPGTAPAGPAPPGSGQAGQP